MCGLVGVWDPDTDACARERIVRAMLSAEAHRGPDGESVWSEGPLTVGFRRLAIVGPPEAMPPWLNGTESDLRAVWTIGEVYNWGDLADGLGVHLQVDTEVIPAALETLTLGEVLPQLHGIFAGCVYDRISQHVTLFRDALGVKPMVWATTGGRVTFGSSVRAVLAATDRAELDLLSLDRYLINGYFPGRSTAFVDIKDVSPGSMLQWGSSQQPNETPWLQARPSGRILARSSRAMVREAVSASIASEIPAVPFAVTLSGGLDSTIVTTLVSRSEHFHSALTVKFEGASDGDYGHAKAVALDLGLHHEVVHVAPADYEQVLDSSWPLDQPLADPNAIGLLLLARRCADLGCRVLIAGEGSDELFGGYSYHKRLARPGARWSYFPKHIGMVEEADVEFARRLTGRHHYPVGPVMLAGLGPYLSSQAWELDHWLEGNLLEKADRCGMCSGVEIRVPFLQAPVVKASQSIPAFHKAPFWRHQGKVVLARAFRDMVPNHVIRRKKVGFSCPIGDWLQGPMGERAFSSLTALRLWDEEAERDMWREHRSGARDWGQQLWRLLVLRRWIADHPERFGI